MSKKIFIKTFGCQMNEYDSNRILDLVKTLDYNLTENIIDADCYVLNTCHIREKATDKVYHDVGRLKKIFKEKNKPILFVTGCVAQAEGQELLKKEPYIDGVIGPQSYHEIPVLIKNIEIKKERTNKTNFDTVEKFDKLNLIKNNNSKVSSFLTIQEGCDKFCHFCVVPYTRGPEYSRTFNEIIAEAKQLLDNGAKEIILLGQNVNAYKYQNYRLSDLILELSLLPTLKRIRYTTSHPKDVTSDLIDVHKNCQKLMPLLHLPVQSGSTKILKKMNRKHNIEEYLTILDMLKKRNSNMKFSSDFIIGYPGETETDFQSTVTLMKDIKFINSYSFIFSPRPGTPAAKLEPINPEIAKKRLKIFQEISAEVKKNYRKSLLNKDAEVLFESKLKNQDKYFGRDKYMNSVIVSSDINLIGHIKNIRIKEFNHSTLFGEINIDILEEAVA